jgi:hypothetical protein
MPSLILSDIESSVTFIVSNGDGDKENVCNELPSVLDLLNMMADVGEESCGVAKASVEEKARNDDVDKAEGDGEDVSECEDTTINFRYSLSSTLKIPIVYGGGCSIWISFEIAVILHD